MSVYRNISVSFWTDPKVDDEFTPEDKYFYLYLLTNPHTNICGCYEISMKQMIRELGYSEDTILNLLKRMEEVHKVIRYGKTNKEVLLLNWGKFNWSNASVKKCAAHEMAAIKTKMFRNYIAERLATGFSENFGEDDGTPCPHPVPTLSTPCTHPVDTTVTVTVTDTVSNKDNRGSGGKKEKQDAFSKFAGEDAALLEALRGFEQMRNAIDKPLTDRAKAMLINKLQTFPKSQWIAILDQSVVFCWQGIFPLKDAPKQQARPTGQPAAAQVRSDYERLLAEEGES